MIENQNSIFPFEFSFDSFQRLNENDYLSQMARISFATDGAMITKDFKVERDDEKYLQKVICTRYLYI